MILDSIEHGKEKGDEKRMMGNGLIPPLLRDHGTTTDKVCVCVVTYCDQPWLRSSWLPAALRHYIIEAPQTEVKKEYILSLTNLHAFLFLCDLVLLRRII